jgi:DNA polymerase III alpha subunit
MQKVIESGAGNPIYAHVSVNGAFQSLKAHFAVDLEALRKKIGNSEELTVYERVLTGKHPILDILPKDNSEARERVYRNLKYKRSSSGEVFYGLVTNVRLRYDKNDNEYAFFGLLGGDGYFIESLAFSSAWLDVRDIIKAGRLLKIEIDKKPDRERGISHIYNGGLVKRIKRERN